MVYTHPELEKFVEDQFKSMSKEEKYERLKNCDPTFEEMVLGQIRLSDTVRINHEESTWSRIKEKVHG